MLILNNTWTTYRSRLSNKIAEVKKIFYLCELETSRNFNVKKTNKEVFLSNIQFRNRLTPTQDIILSHIPLKLFSEKKLLIFGWSYWQFIIVLFVRKLLHRKTYVFFESVSTGKPHNQVKTFIKKIFLSSKFIYLSPSKSSDLYLNQIYSNAKVLRTPNFSIYEPELQLVKTKTRQVDFLFVGRNSSEKNIDLLKELYFKYRSTYNFLFIGDQFDFITEESHKKPFTQNIEEIYLNSKFLLLPSKSEPYGMVAIEAYSCGCIPLVSENCGVTSELPEEFVIDENTDLDQTYSEYEKYFAKILDDFNRFSLQNSLIAFNEIFKKL